ncbi:Cys-tRNA(Pro) deacylase [Mycetocola reblochoni]|uniref:Cys-tRNA(Pro)/Cys-tRNA(Cys) deacylase n=2 Tax=Mycetocola reblochoni TaxID=331618 RepID=A0A1R4INM3_9MICO|nr:Cys-tRNA(Pro) deacylase [Mycetocola reblochoni]RLP67885.1 Cys-tRNA(Pro) deacylase [Mycetocola reblochoni]SJN21471.1 Cys-tRNA(Pro) deacylase YbaK [Mycetocola reblochoni REB411]
MGRRTPTGTPALAALTAAGTPHRVHEYRHDPASALSFGAEAAAALGVDPALVFKTLIAAADGALVVAVVPVLGSLDLKALAHAVGAKRAELADPARAERSSGYVRGGISPIGQRTPLPTVIDDSANGVPSVFVSAGRRGQDVELAADDLAALTSAVFAPIARRG